MTQATHPVAPMRERAWLRPAAAALCVALAALPATAEPDAEPDAQRLGQAQGWPLGRAADGSWYANPHRVGSWSAMDQVGLPVRVVPRGDGPVMPLPAADDAPAIRWRFRNIGYSVDEYLARNRITGLLVIKDGRIVTERYRYGRTPAARFLSFSMAKSVTSLLVGIALDRGAIASLDDPAERYAKALEGSTYGATSIRHLLRMSSGLRFTERYDGTDDIARLSRAAATGNPTVTQVLRGIDDRQAPPGERFAYASAETEVLGLVLAGATGRALAQLTAEWLWQPMGAESDAFWIAARNGAERASGFFNAALRDWGRLGVLLAQDGRAGGRQLLAREYLLDATDPQRQPPAFRPQRATPYFGYGYQFWLMPLRQRTFALQGIHGQTLYVQPASGIVMVQTAVYEHASGTQDLTPFQERDAFWRGVLASLGGSTD